MSWAHIADFFFPILTLSRADEFGVTAFMHVAEEIGLQPCCYDSERSLEN